MKCNFILKLCLQILLIAEIQLHFQPIYTALLPTGLVYLKKKIKWAILELT